MVGITRVAMQARLFVAQDQYLPRHVAVVVRAWVFTALRPSAPGLFTQVAPFAEGQEGHHQRSRQGDDMRGRVAAFLSRLARTGTHKVGQSRQVGFTMQRQDMGGFVVQNVLRKTGGECGQLLHHRGIARLRLRRQARARAHKVQVQALD